MFVGGVNDSDGDGGGRGGEGGGAGADAGTQAGARTTGVGANERPIDLIARKIATCRSIICPVVEKTIENTRQASIFKCVLSSRGLRRTRMTRALKEMVKKANRTVEGREHLNRLTEEREVPDENALQYIEKLENVSFEVYRYIQVGQGKLVTEKIRKCAADLYFTASCDGQDARVPCTKETTTVLQNRQKISVVLYKGIYYYISNVNMFEIVDDRQFQNPDPRLRWLVNHRHVYTLTKDNYGKAYSNKLCFFRALAIHRRACCVETETRKLYNDFAKFYREKHGYASRYLTEDTFDGINIARELEQLEDFFHIKINLYRHDLCERGKRTRKGEKEEEEVEGEGKLGTHICPAAFRLSQNKSYPETLNLIAYKQHLCLIKDMESLSGNLICGKCRKSIQFKGAVLY